MAATPDDTAPAEPPVMYNWMAARYFRERPAVAVGYALTMLTFPLGIVVIPALGGMIVDAIKDDQPFSAWRGKVLLICMVLVVLLGAYTAGMYMDAYTKSDFQAYIRGAMFDRLVLARSYRYRSIRVTSTMAKLTTIPEDAFWVVKKFRDDLIPGLVTLVALTFYMYWVDPRLGAMLTGLIAIISGMMASGAFVCQDGVVGARYGGESVLEQLGDTLDTLRGMLTSAATGQVRDRLAEARRKQVRRYNDALRCIAHFTILVKVIAAITLLAIVMLSYRQYKDGTLPSAKFMSLVFVLMTSRHILFNAMSSLPLLLTGNGSLIRLSRYLEDLDAEIAEDNTLQREAAAVVPPCTVAPRLVMTNVTFRYPGADVDAVRNVSLDLQANDKMIISGHIGSGKSTLADLMLGMHTPSAGTVTVCGHNVAALNRRSIARLVAFIPQGPRLPNLTVHEVLSYGLPAVTRAQAAAALTAHNVTFVDIDDRVGKFGENLSTGQRTILMLIRAVLQNASIVIADEVIANLDPTTTGEVTAVLQQVTRDRILVFISHATSVPNITFTHTVTLSAGAVV